MSQFQAAHTQVLGVSVDSIYSHANWAKDLGGISFPLLADFHPKGAMSQSFGLYLEDNGITDRATVIIDAGGTIQYSKAVGPGGERNIDDLVKECQTIDKGFQSNLESASAPKGLPAGTTLFVKSNCGFSRSALLARDNLHLSDKVIVKNVSQDTEALSELKRITQKEQAPCLVVEQKPLLESQEIVNYMVNHVAPL